MLKIDPLHVTRSVKTFCALPFQKIILTANGAVSMCCHQGIPLGGLGEDVSIMDLWTSPLAEEIRDKTFRGELHEVCSCRNTCPFIKGERQRYDPPSYPNARRPLCLEICLPMSHCNIGGEEPSPKNPACLMCRRNFSAPNEPNLVEFLCEKAKPLMPFLQDLMVLGTAEPFWKDIVFKVFELLDFSSHKHHCRFSTNTNAICLSERVLTRLFAETESSSIFFSIDAASPITYRKIRRVNAYETVLKNIRRFLAMRTPSHRATIYNNINLLNVEEMSKMVEVAVELGVDAMVMLPTYTIDNSVKLGELLLCEKNVDLFKECSEAAMQRARELGMPLKYSGRFDAPIPDAEIALPD